MRPTTRHLLRTAYQTARFHCLSTTSSSQKATTNSNGLLRPFLPTIIHGPIVRNAAGIRRTMATAAAAQRLAGKTVVITGASSGIGRSTALEFARTAPKNGLRLVLTARRVDQLEKLAADIRAELGDGVAVLPVKLDVSDPAAVRGFVPSLPEEWRNIDVLVNNA